MTEADIPRPLRRALLFRAADGYNRDAILKLFPGLDGDEASAKLDAAHQARVEYQPSRAEQIVAELIKEDREART